MGFMQAQVVGPTDWWEVDTHEGIFFVQAELIGKEKAEILDLHRYIEVADVSHILEWERKTGYGARLSAPGYQDCTEWTVFDTEQEAREYLVSEHDLCPICLDDDWLDRQCQTCIQKLTHDELFEALVEYICENVSTGELVSNYWNTLSEDYNNEMLQWAYDKKVTEYESRPPGRCGTCENCRQLERVKQRVMAAANPPFSHADDGVTNLWNKELERLPCKGSTNA